VRVEDLEALSDHFYWLLADTIHVGAYEQAKAGLGAIIKRCVDCLDCLGSQACCLDCLGSQACCLDCLGSQACCFNYSTLREIRSFTRRVELAEPNEVLAPSIFRTRTCKRSYPKCCLAYL
jgi:hypothetical protein